MQKRGQVRVIFTWILILIIAISILYLGINLIRKFTNLSEKAVIENEIKKIENQIEQIYYLDVDSSKELQLNFPDSVREICFVHDPEADTTPIYEKPLPEELIEFLQGKDASEFDYNFFVLGDEAKFLRIKHMKIEDSNKLDEERNECPPSETLNVCKKGRDKIKLINKGVYVKIKGETC